MKLKMADSYLFMPSEWLHTTLEPNAKVGAILKVDSGSTPKTEIDEYWDGDIPWLTPKEITRNKEIFVSSTERTITELGLSSCGTKILPSSTVMMSKRAPVGAIAVNTTPMCTNQGFLNFQCGPKLRPLYLAHWLRINKPYLDAVANGSTYQELYKSDLFEFQIAIPPTEEQDEILKVVSALEFSLHSHNSLIFKTLELDSLIDLEKEEKELKSAIDQVKFLLFSGKVKVSELSRGEK